MRVLLDTDVAIHLRDLQPEITFRIEQLDTAIFVSALTAVEIESGVYRDLSNVEHRRKAADGLFARVESLPFHTEEVAAYRHIVSIVGYNRSRLIDRLIAATAIANDLVLITINGDDFRDIPDLRLEIWPAVQ